MLSRRDTARGVAWALLGLCVSLTVLGEVLFLWNRPAGPPVNLGSRDTTALAAVAFLAFPTFGLLIRLRRPANPLWWLFSAIGLSNALWIAADGWAVRALWVEPGSLPGGDVAAWLGNLIWAPGWALMGLLLLRFPTGTLPSARWRPALALPLVAGVGLTAGLAVMPGALRDYPYAANPFAFVDSRGVPVALMAVGLAATAMLGMVALAALFRRLRDAEGVIRQQLKWVTFAAASNIVPIVAGIVLVPLGVRNLTLEALAYLMPATIPIAAGVAILRYRLYEIDRLISKTLVYLVLSVSLFGGYATLVLALGVLLPVEGGSDVVVALSTLAVAASFGPLRRRVQVAVDARFSRARYDAARIVAGFGRDCRQQMELDALTAELTEVVTAAVRPSHVSVWLRKRDTAGE